MSTRTQPESTTCQTCSGTKWHNNRLCHRCEISTEQAKNLILDRARGRGGSMSPADAVAALDEFEARGPMPVFYWDGDLGAYQFEDGDEAGLCNLPTTTDALNVLWQGRELSYEKMHKLGDDWGFRTLILRDHDADADRLIHTGDYRELPTSRAPECYEPQSIPEGAECVVKRAEFRARCHSIEKQLEDLSHRKVALNYVDRWRGCHDDELRQIKADEARLETEHAALKNMLGLPDAELLECLAELEGARAVAS